MGETPDQGILGHLRAQSRPDVLLEALVGGVQLSQDVPTDNVQETFPQSGGCHLIEEGEEYVFLNSSIHQSLISYNHGG